MPSAQCGAEIGSEQLHLRGRQHNAEAFVALLTIRQSHFICLKE